MLSCQGEQAITMIFFEIDDVVLERSAACRLLNERNETAVARLSVSFREADERKPTRASSLRAFCAITRLRERPRPRRPTRNSKKQLVFRIALPA